MYVCLPELQRKMCVNVGGMLLCVAVQYHFGGGFFFCCTLCKSYSLFKYLYHKLQLFTKKEQKGIP